MADLDSNTDVIQDELHIDYKQLAVEVAGLMALLRLLLTCPKYNLKFYNMASDWMT